MAVVSGTCADLTGAATTLAKAGAAAMVAYAGRRSAVRGHHRRAVGLPALQAGPSTPRPCWPAAARPAKLVTTPAPATCTTWCGTGADGVPDGGTVDGTGTSVAALVEHYNGMGSTSADGLQAVEELVGWVPERGGVANIGLVRAVPFPTTVTHYVSTGAVWERTVAIQDAAVRRRVRPALRPTPHLRRRQHDARHLVRRPDRLPRLAADLGHQRPPPPTRENDELFLSMGAFTDAAGHLANSDIFSDEYSGQIYVDDELVLDMFASVFMNTTIPAGEAPDPGRHRDPAREPVLAAVDRGSRPSGLRLDPPQASCEVLPMLGVDYRMALSSTNSAPAGSTTSPSGSRCPTPSRRGRRQAQRRDLVGRRPDLEVRPTTRCGDTSCTVRVRNEAGGHASLRV